MILLLPLLLLLSSCAGIPNTESVTGCPPVQWIYQDGTSHTATDDWMEKEAQEGCVRHYGAGACLVRVLKRAELNYWAICRRADGGEASE